MMRTRAFRCPYPRAAARAEKSAAQAKRATTGCARPLESSLEDQSSKQRLLYV
jgi:hypothetical protein